MILIKKGKEPNALLEYRCKPGATFDGFLNPGKGKLRTSLLKEQGHICAYCMKTIADAPSTKIEHYEKRSVDNQLIYSNLLAVCDGQTKSEGKCRKHDLTCDSFKGDDTLKINPCKQEHIDTIRYNFVSGEISSTVPDYDKDLNRVLNLNNPRLQDNRKFALRQIKNELISASKQEQGKFKKTVEKIYAHYHKTEGQQSAYVGIILAYLEKS